MLQSKPVRRSESENVQEGIADIKERIRLIQDRANLLSGLFASLCRLVLVTSSSLCSPPDAPSDTLIAGEAPLHTVNISLMPRNASGGAELVSVTEASKWPQGRCWLVALICKLTMHFFLSINAVAGAKAILLDDFYLVMIRFLLPQRLFVSESGARSHSPDSECFIPLTLWPRW